VSEPYYSQRARSVCVSLSAFFSSTSTNADTGWATGMASIHSIVVVRRGSRMGSGRPPPLSFLPGPSFATDTSNHYTEFYFGKKAMLTLNRYHCGSCIFWHSTVDSRTQWLKWSCEAGGGAHLTKRGWCKPHTHFNPTNLALFEHKITLYRFNQGAHTVAGGSNGSRG